MACTHDAAPLPRRIPQRQSIASSTSVDAGASTNLSKVFLLMCEAFVTLRGR